MFRLTQTCIFSMMIIPMLSLFSQAELEQKLLPINENNKQITLTLFHYNTVAGKASIKPVEKDIGSTIEKFNGKSAITIQAKPGISIVDDKIVFDLDAIYLVNNGTTVNPETVDTFSKHTFIMSNGKGSFVLGYAPLCSPNELTYAIQQYIKSNKFNYHTVALLNSGNSSGFYKANGNYHPYYLKELNPAKQMLMIK